MPINDDDLLLINDGTETQTITFAQLKDGSMLNDTDKFLVNDGTKTETITWDQLQQEIITPPEIDSVVLSEDEPESSKRFTNEAFTTTIVMADDGTPESTKSIRGWVEGSLIPVSPESDEIVGVSGDGLTLTFSSDQELSQFAAGDVIQQDNADLHSSTASQLDPSDTVGGSITNEGLTFTASTASTYSRSIVTVETDERVQFEMTVDSIGSGALIGFSQEGTDGSPGPTIVGAVYDSTGNFRYTNNWSSGAVGASYTTGDIVGATLDNSTGEVTFYKNGARQGAVTIDINQPMKLYVHSNNGQVTANFGADGFTYPVDGFSNFQRLEPSGIVGSVDAAGLTLTMSKVFGDWGPANSGRYAVGPAKAGGYTKEYLVLDSNLNVTGLQSAETAFTPVNTLAPKIQFGSTLGTADAPDDVLPAGTTIQTEVKAESSPTDFDTQVSNLITPIKNVGPKATMNGLRFDSKNRQTYLYREFDWSSTWTMSFWAKPTVNNYYINGWINTSNSNANCAHYKSNTWKWYSSGNGGESTNSSPAVEYNQWQHIIYKCDNNVISVSKNGGAWQECTGLGTSFYGNEFSCSGGAGSGNYTGYGGYQSDLYFVDGRADLEPTDFGADFEGKWGPLKSTDVLTAVGDFGTNGFFLPFNFDEGIGTDTSGNGNNFNADNFFLGGVRTPSTGVVTGSIQPSHPVSNIFDGDLTTYTRPEGNAEAQVDMTPPYDESELTSLRFYIKNESTDPILDTDCFKVNGVDYSYLVTQTAQWITIPENRFDSFSMRSNGVSSVPNVFQVEINGGVFGFGGLYSANVTYKGDYFAGSAEEIFNGDPTFTKLVVTQTDGDGWIKWEGKLENVTSLSVFTERGGYVEVVGNLGTIQQAYNLGGSSVEVSITPTNLAAVGTTITSIRTVWNSGGVNQVYMYSIKVNGSLLIDDTRTVDYVKDTPMLSYAVLDTGANGNLEATGSSSITYLGEAGTDYYYEEDGSPKKHVGGTSFASVSGKQYNFGQQPFVNPPLDIWSDYISGTQVDDQGDTFETEVFDKNLAFDGDTTSRATIPHDNTISLTSTMMFKPPEPIACSKVRVWVYQPQGTSGAFTYLRFNETGDFIRDDEGWATTGANGNGWSAEFNMPPEGFSAVEIQLQYDGMSTNRLYAVEIDGQVLIEDDESIALARGNELSQTWLEWNGVAELFASNPAHVAKFEAIKDALEHHEGDVRQFRADMVTRLAVDGFSIQEMDALNLVDSASVTAWAQYTGYEDGNLVTHNGEYWFALSSSYNNSPDDNDPEDWVSLGVVPQ